MAIVSRCCRLTSEFRVTSPTQVSSLTYLKIATARYGLPPTAAYIVVGLMAVWRDTASLAVYRLPISTTFSQTVRDVCGRVLDCMVSFSSWPTKHGQPLESF